MGKECLGCDNHTKGRTCLPEQYSNQGKLTEHLLKSECPAKCPLRKKMSQTAEATEKTLETVLSK